MRVVKPNQVSVLSRPYDYEGKYRLCITGLVLFPFAEPRYPMTESALWLLVGKELGETAVDDSMPKHHGEVLLRANAYAPGGKPQSVLRVAVELDGNLLKEAAVVGDRVWKNSIPTPPEPFVTKSLRWEEAFGGNGYKPNPLGKGHAPKDGSPLPTVEDPKKFITSMRQTPDPVGFGPYDMTWPQRMENAGLYDKEWLEKYYPGLGRNIDWNFFNVAPPDQQIPGFFRGDEEFVLRNLHPEKSELKFKLPEVRLRSFLRRKRRSGEEVQSEVGLRLDTIWLFPHAAHGILVFHGTTPVREDDASDVTTLFMACEDIGQPKTLEHYNEVFDRRLSKEHGAVAALDDRPLMPALRGDMKGPPSPADEMTELCATEQLSYNNMIKKGQRHVEQARDVVRAQGLDLDQHAPAPIQAIDTSGSLEELLGRMDRMEEEANEQRRIAEEAFAEKELEIQTLCEEAGLDFEEIRKEWRGPMKGGPPTRSSERDISRLQGLADDGRAAGFDVREIDDYLADPAFVARIHEQDTLMLEAYRVGAQDRSEPDTLSAEESLRLRNELCSAHQRGESLAGRDLTGADLSGIELLGANLEEALMERCNLTKADLTGANLRRAVLVRADLSGARLDGSNLEGANLSKADCSEASFANCQLKDAMLIGTRFVSANLNGMLLERAVLSGTLLERCSMSRIRAEGVLLENIDLVGTSFSQALLKDAVFMKCGLDDVDFTGADLTSATFFGCRGKSTLFTGIQGKSLRVVEGTEFEECYFLDADLTSACLRGTSLVRCDFTGARAAMADFSECNMQGAVLYHLVAPQSRFVRTDLSGANMIGADLFEAVLSKAVVCGTNLSGANLYQADMSLVRGDEATDVQDAITIRVRIKPLYTTKIQDLD